MKYVRIVAIALLVIIILLLSKCSSDQSKEIQLKKDYIEYLENNNKQLNIKLDSTNGAYLSKEKALIGDIDHLMKSNTKLSQEISKLKKMTSHDIVAATDVVIENNTFFGDTIFHDPVPGPDMVFVDEYIGPIDSIYHKPYTVFYKQYYNNNREGIIIDTIKSEHELAIFLDDDANINVITENGSQVVDLDAYIDPKKLKKLSKKYNKNNFNVSVGLGASLIATPDGPKFGPGINLSVGKTIFSW